MDIASIIGILIDVFALVAALMMESSSIATIIQPMAALIVFGGTLGAILINFSLSTLIAAFYDVKKVFIDENQNMEEIIDQLSQLANIARRNGMLALSEIVPSIENDFLRRG